MCESDRRLTIIIFLLREALPPPLVNFSRIVIERVIGPSRWKITDFFINKVLSMRLCFGYNGYTFLLSTSLCFGYYGYNHYKHFFGSDKASDFFVTRPLFLYAV